MFGFVYYTELSEAFYALGLLHIDLDGWLVGQGRRI